ncbi:hypothetical protein M422DRAFT_264296 [Sphaerobolus stellatus SS14]|uniref:Uncharacterized protein n=1 Tax=Sphaerobolus stellatus (strain SS14) TaxID=990650 RepID=A0A0C9TTL1_SPHS4|nr:hypothetical protein M422DRAFT_264296 [Sphaerobolus stellatus SS14]
MDILIWDVDELMLLSSHPSSKETETIFLASGLDLKTIIDYGINYLKRDVTFGRSKTAPKLELEKEKREESSGKQKSFLCITRHLVHSTFDIEQDDDIINHKFLSLEDMKSQKPDLNNLCIDMIGPISSAWNIAVIEIIHDWLAAWKKFRPRFLADGTVETVDALYQRIEEIGNTRATEARYRSRCSHKFERRVKTVKMSIVLQQLGIDGMSSEDTDSSNVIQTIYCVKIMEWRHNIDYELDLIEQKQLVDDEIYCPQGSKPAHQRQLNNNHTSARDPVLGLPRYFYNGK